MAGYTKQNMHLTDGIVRAAVPIDKISKDIKVVTPPLLRPPELLLDHPWSTPIDIWAGGGS